MEEKLRGGKRSRAETERRETERSIDEVDEKRSGYDTERTQNGAEARSAGSGPLVSPLLKSV